MYPVHSAKFDSFLLHFLSTTATFLINKYKTIKKTNKRKHFGGEILVYFPSWFYVLAYFKPKHIILFSSAELMIFGRVGEGYCVLNYTVTEI